MPVGDLMGVCECVCVEGFRLGLAPRERQKLEVPPFLGRGLGCGLLPHQAQPLAVQLCRSGQLAGALHFLGPRLPPYLREP